MTFWGRELSAEDVRLVNLAVDAVRRAGRMLRTNEVSREREDIRRLNWLAVTGVLEEAGLEVVKPIQGWPGVQLKPERGDYDRRRSDRRRQAGTGGRRRRVSH